VEADVLALEGDARERKRDDVVAEEPLELRLLLGGTSRNLAVTMRTPGNDFELAAGFVYDEAIVRSRDEITEITYCIDPAVDPEQRYNIVNVELRAGSVVADPARFERHFTMSSSCGVCGRAQLDSLRDLGIAPIEDDLRAPARLLYALPERMRAAQRLFASTGGLHAAALFDERGAVAAVREDVGRHNALDKLVGWGLLNGCLPFTRSLLMVSGRASYEILQKSAMARIPIVASVSAPSSLAIDLAREFNITLVGFLRGEHANVYSAPARIV
jgi:FdhD protein